MYKQAYGPPRKLRIRTYSQYINSYLYGGQAYGSMTCLTGLLMTSATGLAGRDSTSHRPSPYGGSITSCGDKRAHSLTDLAP